MHIICNNIIIDKELQMEIIIIITIQIFQFKIAAGMKMKGMTLIKPNCMFLIQKRKRTPIYQILYLLPEKRVIKRIKVVVIKEEIAKVRGGRVEVEAGVEAGVGRHRLLEKE